MIAQTALISTSAMKSDQRLGLRMNTGRKATHAIPATIAVANAFPSPDQFIPPSGTNLRRLSRIASAMVCAAMPMLDAIARPITSQVRNAAQKIGIEAAVMDVAAIIGTTVLRAA